MIQCSVLRVVLSIAALLWCLVAAVARSGQYECDEASEAIASRAFGYNYAYAPALVRHGGRLHMFYCSSPRGSNGWDAIRHSSSVDGVAWTTPGIILEASSKTEERASCDPSVVKYRGPNDDRSYFYLFYSGAPVNVQTAMFVARAEGIAGPYKKLSAEGAWIVDAPNPSIIIGPNVAKSEGSGWYGAGQQTVVVREGRLFSWYTDVTLCSNRPCNQILTSSTADPARWPKGTPVGVEAASVDVKWDGNENLFVMFAIGSDHKAASGLVELFTRTSSDGVSWSRPEKACRVGGLPRWAHNPGVSGDVSGHLVVGDPILLGYGAPYSLDPKYNADCKIGGRFRCRGYWDLYTTLLRTAGIR